MNLDYKPKKNAYVTLEMRSENLFWMEFSEKGADDSEFAEYLKFLDQHYIEWKSDFYQVIDTRKSPAYMPAKHRIELGNWMKKNKELIQKHNKAAAFIAPSLMHQILMKAIFVIQGYPVPYSIVKNEQEAIDFLKTKGYKEVVTA